MILQLPYPVSANKYWRSGILRGRVTVYVSAEAKSYRTQVAWIAAAAKTKVTGKLVSVDVILYPKARKCGEASAVLMDLDNALKITIDALKGVAYIDDKQVRKISAQYGDPVKGGGLMVRVVEL
jgi:crossover junction endodeoxyribonuclease RusA